MWRPQRESRNLKVSRRGGIRRKRGIKVQSASSERGELNVRRRAALVLISWESAFIQ